MDSSKNREGRERLGSRVGVGEGRGREGIRDVRGLVKEVRNQKLISLRETMYINT